MSSDVNTHCNNWLDEIRKQDAARGSSDFLAAMNLLTVYRVNAPGEWRGIQRTLGPIVGQST